MTLDQIVTGPRPAPLVAYAARELAGYTHALTGRKPRVAATARRTAGRTVLLDAGARNLSDQGYALRPIDTRAFAIDGGSPKAVMWGVYDLVERWGVRYELHGDIMPGRPRLGFPARPVICEPDLKLRSFRTYNDFANNPSHWAARDYRVLIDQVAKLRYNGILFCVGPYDPFVDLRFRGARKTLTAPDFGWRPEIRPDHPGYDQFVASGDARRGAFVSADLTGHDRYEDAVAAAQSYARKVFRMAHARGMSCLVIARAADFDPNIRRRIRELTRPRHKVRRTPIHRICYGEWREGPEVETGRCMSINNPVFMDAIAANIQAHVDALPDADTFFFNSTEFGGSDADCERAWKALDRKYGLSALKTLPALQREARRLAEENPDRSERELRGDIVLLCAFDKLINERGFDLSKARKGCSVMPGGLAPELCRFLPLMFGRGSHYMASFGYVPSYVATRANALRQKDPEAIRYTLVTSAEDDNVGLLPQMTGPSVHKIIEALRDVGAHGVQTRHWMHANLLPTFHYIAHAAWEKGWTPRSAYRHLYEPICGPRATPHILRAIGRLERITEFMHRDIICVSFPVPRWITGLWEQWPATLTPAVLQRIGKAYASAADDLSTAVRGSRPAGRNHLFALERHVRHAVYYCRALLAMHRARIAEDAATAARHGEVERKILYGNVVGGRFDHLHAARKDVTRYLAEAESLMRRSCEVFAEGVCDRIDLGALASLNSYNLDVLAALARVARAKGDMFSCRET